jgi:serine/threonine-protein kinase
MSAEQATAALRAVGLSARVDQANVNAERNTVTAQSPSPGTAVAPGTAAAVVTLQVATGQVAVPDVTGKPREEALRMLYSAGFTVPVVRERKDNRVAAGNAVATLPEAGRVAARGSGVELTLSSGR